MKKYDCSDCKSYNKLRALQGLPGFELCEKHDKMTTNIEKAFDDLKRVFKDLRKGDSIGFNHALPKEVETWVKQECKKKGVYLYPFKGYFSYMMGNKKQITREKREQKEYMDFWEDYFNSPG